MNRRIGSRSRRRDIGQGYNWLGHFWLGRERGGGFTLIELAVVMLLITIVLAVAIPQFKTGVLQDPTKKLSRWMITTVKTLRGLSIEKQEIQTLVIDVDRNRMYTVSADMSEENLSAAAEKAFKLPGDLRIVDIVFPDKEHDASGTAQISFYPAGFSDQALIRLENGHAERFAYMIEPLLPKIKFLEEWPSF